ncbi:MAG TPA: GTP-binding protein, partial [Saprospiraceae bacterium]|nr:GTP-binding protein [Saprospiraceae bacterium]
KNLEFDLKYMDKVLPGVLIKVVGNKKDLISTDQLEALKKELYYPADIYTSAKTGENVEPLFQDLAKSLKGDFNG